MGTDLHPGEPRGLHSSPQRHGIRHSVASHKPGGVVHLCESLINLDLVADHDDKLQT